MLTIFVSLVVLLVLVGLMSIGVIMGRKPVQGSCGGLNNINGMDECELCGGSKSRCEQVNAQ